VAPRAQGDLAIRLPLCSLLTRGAGDVTGKTIVDISNSVTPDYSGLALGFTTSAAEEIQEAVPTAKVVKAFNTTFAQVLGAAPDRTRAQVLDAGGDAGAKAAVRALIEIAGFEAVDAGPLANARLLEPLGMLNILLRLRRRPRDRHRARLGPRRPSGHCCQ
jgi:predicted dinucleotide-binding enzyme